jgi:hypothetical protein
VRSALNSLGALLKADPNGKTLPIRVSEFNCYADGTAQARRGVDVIDGAQAGAFVGGQVAGMMGRTHWVSLQKATQTPSSKPSGVIKNGVMWGDGGFGAPESPGYCHIGGTTKAAEAYRLQLLRSPGAKKLYNMTFSPPLPGLSNLSMYTVASSLVSGSAGRTCTACTNPQTFKFLECALPPRRPTTSTPATSPPPPSPWPSTSPGSPASPPLRPW